ncbi:MAG: SHOCT domain-containing protein [Nanoarchaeota archaeon]
MKTNHSMKNDAVKMEKESYSWILVALILLSLGSSMLMGRSHMGFGMGLGFVLMPVFWMAVILLIFELFRREHEKTDSLEILKNRYARGEISKRQFEQTKKELV